MPSGRNLRQGQRPAVPKRPSGRIFDCAPSAHAEMKFPLRRVDFDFIDTALSSATCFGVALGTSKAFPAPPFQTCCISYLCSRGEERLQ